MQPELMRALHVKYIEGGNKNVLLVWLTYVSWAALLWMAPMGSESWKERESKAVFL